MAQANPMNEDEASEKTSLGIRRGTKRRFLEMGHAGQSQDELLNDLMNQVATLQEKVAEKEERIRALENE